MSGSDLPSYEHKNDIKQTDNGQSSANTVNSGSKMDRDLEYPEGKGDPLDSDKGTDED
jgi:hypothetical protein